MMRGLSEDPDAYAALHKAEARHLNVLLDDIPNGKIDFAHSGGWRDAGSVLGAYTAIREDVINDDRMTEYNKADWKSKIAYHVVGGAITPLTLPVGGRVLPVGDMLQRGVDTWAWQWGNEMKGEADMKADALIADKYLDSAQQVSRTVDGWAAGRSDIDRSTKDGEKIVGTLKGLIGDSHTSGSTHAHKYL